MAEDLSNSLCNLWTKLQAVFATPASSCQTVVLPKLTQLNDMVYEVHKPQFEEKPELEIVLCHGLQLNRCKEAHITTWLSHDDSEFWPQTWLVEEFPKSRILTISYDSAVKKTNEDGHMDMFCTRENLLSSLTSDCVKVGEFGSPIVLVGHCFGGLLLKELCLHANKTMSEKSAELPGMDRIRDFFNNVRGMFFYSTPHIGSLLGDKLHDCFEGVLLAEITTLNASSARKNESFCDLKSNHKWLTYGMGEIQKTFVDYLGQYVHVVPEASSRQNMDTYYSVDENHFNICKPQGKMASSFICLRDFIHKIYEENLPRLSNMVDEVTGREYVVDMQDRAGEVESMLAQPDAHTIFIVGLTGIGKTTLARKVFRDISGNFPVKCFVHLDNIEAGSHGNEQVLRNIQEELKRQGKGLIGDYFSVPNYLKSKKVLLVLDNVQSESQLDTIDRAIWLEGSSSRLIVTTTNSRLGCQPNTFKVEFLCPAESEALFVHFVFQGREKPQSLEYSIKQVIRKCENFPLSLKILGRYLSKADVLDKELWKDLLVRLENAEEVASGPDYQLWPRLRPCYYALTPSEQEIFLDVATVFCGFPLNYVKDIWSACRVTAHLSWINLERAFLVSGDEHHPIEMHGLLRDLGRSIACTPSCNIDKWRRVSGGWGSTKEFIVRFKGVMETLSLEVQVNERLTMINAPFAQYVKLEYLILDGIETEGNVELPSSLVYLRWNNGLFEACPVDFNYLENLVALDLKFCKTMKILPSSVGKAKKLKWLELDGCGSLTDLSLELHKLSDLEYLGLSMTGITMLPTNLGKLKKLRCLRANNTDLVKVPESIGRVRMLLSLNISNTSVKVLPDSIGNLKLLTELRVNNTLLSSLPDTIGRLERLQVLAMSNTTVKVLPESIGDLKFLTDLNASYTSLRSLPDSIGRLERLQFLAMSNTTVKTLPESIGDLESLTYLNASHTSLRSLPDSIGRLERLLTLMINGTKVRVLPESVGDLKFLTYLHAEETLLSSLPEGIGCLESLRGLYLSHTRIKGLPQSLGDVAELEYLHLESTPLEALPDSIGKLQSLCGLYLSNTQISALPDAIGELGALQSLQLYGTRLRSLPTTIQKLFRLDHFECTISTRLIDSDQLGLGLQSTILGSQRDLGCSVDLVLLFGEKRGGAEDSGVQEEGQIPGAIVSFSSLISTFDNVEAVRMLGGHYQKPLLPTLLYPLQQMSKLRSLTLQNFSDVETIPSEIDILPQLHRLEVEYCDKLREFPETLGKLLHLDHLRLVGLPSLCRLPESMSTICAVPSLLLEVFRCESLQSMPSSCGHASPLKRDFSTSGSGVCTTSDSNPILYPVLNNARRGIDTDSWGLLRCLLECCNLGQHFTRIRFYVECQEMERLSKMAVVDGEGEENTLSTKNFRELCSECHVGDDGPHGVFAPATCWAPLNDLSKIKVEVHCLLKALDDSLTETQNWSHDSCPSGLRVLDMEEDGDEDTEEDLEQDEAEVDSEDMQEDVDEEDTQSEQSDDEEIKGE